VNLHKSKLVLFGNVLGAFDLAAVLGCKVSSLPMTYLGLPFGSSFKVCVVWSSIIEKMERSLVGWKKLYLSKRGRLYRIIEYLGKLHTKPYGSALPL
jgi:hypothetical protein